MLLSMTGYGEARAQREGLQVAVEVRTINNRYFKLSFRCGEGYNSLESEVENVVRGLIKRGTVNVTLRVDREARPEDYQLNLAALEAYRQQLDTLAKKWHVVGGTPPHYLLELPGVVKDPQGFNEHQAAEWPLIRETLEAAIANLDKMRAGEGAAMAAAIRQNCHQISVQLEAIRKRAPQVVEHYRTRLEDRLRRALAELEVTLDSADVARELTIFCDRCDISEEVVRLASHVDQLLEMLQSAEPSGRKLEFLTQEMFREANTIGSKANDVEIAQKVIDVKTDIERIREMIQNAE